MAAFIFVCLRAPGARAAREQDLAATATTTLAAVLCVVRIQGVCLQSERALVLISGGDGATIGPRVLRLSKPPHAGAGGAAVGTSTAEAEATESGGESSSIVCLHVSAQPS